MKHLIVCCLLVAVAAKEKKISLEDIEKDNLRLQKIPPPPEREKSVSSPVDYTRFLPVRTASGYARQEPKPVHYEPQVQYAAPQPQYYYPENSGAPQYQYVYLQPYAAPTTAVQNVVNPKNGLQYIMYVPSYPQEAQQTQTYENVVYTNQPEYSQYYEQPQGPVPSIQYAPEQPREVYVQKQEPQSLLDSYVPSYLQVQYYKQQQAQQNALQHSIKESSRPIAGKTDYIKSYSPQNRHNSAESIVNYSYLNPGTYHKYHQ